MTPAALARTTDPTTSRQAAASVTGITRLQANVLALFHHHGPMTDGDLLDLHQQMVDAGDYPPATPSGVRTRRNELVASGRLVDTGERSTTAAARACIVWGLPADAPRPPSSFALIPRPRTATRSVLDEVLEERKAQDTKWGQHNHPDGTGGDGWINEARDAKHATDEAAARGEVTWLDILFEEVAEAFAEDDTTRLRAELIQVAAVAVSWAEAIDRRAQ